MLYRRLGKTGLRVSLFSMGGWLTFGAATSSETTKSMIKACWERGITTFDTAEVYANGECEVAMGQAIRELGIPRKGIVIITKIFFGTGSLDPNGAGLSRKHIIEGANASLKRLEMDYADCILAHCPDVTVPMEEVVRAFNRLLDDGKCFYWGTSAWNATQIQEAHAVADRLGLVGPACEQPQYNMFARDAVERDLAPLHASPAGLGTTVWSPLASGLLTGKYNDGTIPKGSRLDTGKDTFNDVIASLQTDEGKSKLAKVRKLGELATELGTGTAQLALAWTAKNENVSTVLIGATSLSQLSQNLEALEVLPKLTPQVMQRIEEILQNRPQEAPRFGR